MYILLQFLYKWRFWRFPDFLFCTSLPFAHLYKTTERKSLVIFWAGILFSLIPLALTYYFFPRNVSEHLFYHIIAIPVQTSVGIWLLMTLFSKSVADKELFSKHLQHEKIETMNHVAASLAHEVRNPLTAVKGFLRLVLEERNNLAKTERYIAICLDEIHRTESILSDYLSISKPLTLRHERIDLSDLLHRVKEVMAPYAYMHQVELNIYTSLSSIAIMANPDEIKQVLVNFIKNGVEACAKVESGSVTLSLVEKGSDAVLFIADNGIGMTEGQLNRLGSIYFSTKSNGTGLGLTYSYQVIHAIGGTISVSSKPQQGTRFVITLPLAPKARANEEKK